MRVRLLSAAKLICAVVLIAALFHYVDWRQGLALLAKARPFPLVFALLLFPVGIVISAVKWGVLLRARGIHISTSQLCRYYWVGFFANNFLPSTVGGDVSRVVLLRQKGKMAEAAASVLIERLTGLAVLLGWAALALAMAGSRFADFRILGLLWGGVAAGLALLVILFFSSEKIAGWLEGALGVRENPVLTKIAALARAVAFYRREKFALLQAILLSIPFYVTPWLLQVLIFFAIDVPVSPWDVFLVAPLINLAGIIPATPNALGLMEGAYVVFYGAIGVLPEGALAAALLSRFLVLIASLGGAGFWLTLRSDD